MRRCRKNAEQVFKLGQSVSGPQLVQIVYHQYVDTGRTSQLRYDRVEDRFAVTTRHSCLPPGIRAASGLTYGAQDAEPELLSVLLVRGHRHERNPAIRARSARPGA